jgi:hypothetical protein
MGFIASLGTIVRQTTAIVLCEEGRTVGLDYFHEGDAPVQGAFATAFLQRLRERAREWVTDIDASDTSADPMGGPIAISISVPGVSGPITTLWVLCRHQPGRAPWLHGSWGDDTYVGDDHGGDGDRDLTVEGLEMTPEELADLAARWLETQLRREIHRDEWDGKRWGRRDELGFTPWPRVRSRWGTPRRSVRERSGGFAATAHSS